jgi:Tol biopolymer transport system component
MYRFIMGAMIATALSTVTCYGEMTVRRIARHLEYPELTSVSPNGDLLSYSHPDNGNLYVRNVRTGADRAVTSNARASGDHAMWSVFSADGQSVAYFWASDAGNEIRIASLSDGQVRRLSSVERGFWMVLCDWSRDGAYILAGRTQNGSITEIVLISTNDGSVRSVVKQPGSAGRMALSADAKWIAHDGPPTGNGSSEPDLYLISVRDGSTRTLVKHGAADTTAGWSHDGNTLYFFSDRTGTNGLWAVAVRDGRAAGPPSVIKQDIGKVVWPLGVTRSGNVYYALDASMTDVYEADLDLTSGSASVQGPVSQRFVGGNSYPSWSPDGKSLLYLSNAPTGGRFLISQGTETREYKPSLLWFNRPEWTRRNIIAVTGSDVAGREGIYGIAPDSGEVQLLIDRAENETAFHGQWTRNGRLYFNRHADARKGIFTLQLDSRAKTTVYVPPNASRVAGLRLSPDEKLLAFEMSGPDGAHVMVLDTTSMTARSVLRLHADQHLPCCRPYTWQPDSRGLLVFIAGKTNRTATAVSVDSDAGRHFPLNMPEMANPDLHPDGKRLLFQSGRRRMEIWELSGFATDEAIQ